MKIHNFEQGTPEWFEIRRGKVTASHAQAIGNNGKGLDTYINQVMAEYFSSAEKEHYSNKDTDRGHELEPIARSIYEMENNVEVSQIGFCELDEFVGCSPDGLVREDGMIEIKCPDDKTYFNILMEEKIDSGYEWQCQMNMLILQRKWCDLIYYNPNFARSMKIFRLEANPEKFDQLEKGFETAREKIKEMTIKYQGL